MAVGLAPQMSHLLARGSGVQEEQWLHRSKDLQSVGSFNTRRCKSTSPQLSQYDVSIAPGTGMLGERKCMGMVMVCHSQILPLCLGIRLLQLFLLHLLL